MLSDLAVCRERIVIKPRHNRYGPARYEARRLTTASTKVMRGVNVVITSREILNAYHISLCCRITKMTAYFKSSVFYYIRGMAVCSILGVLVIRLLWNVGTSSRLIYYSMVITIDQVCRNIGPNDVMVWSATSSWVDDSSRHLRYIRSC
jgi:hypothetical protein